MDHIVSVHYPLMDSQLLALFGKNGHLYGEEFYEGGTPFCGKNLHNIKFTISAIFECTAQWH